MLKLLHIENIAVIEKADIEFAPGLNVLTGETGTGKSIVIDALSAVTGGRTSRDIVRTGADNASVTAVFSTSAGSAWLSKNGFEPDEEGEVFIARKISADGKSVCRVNGAPVSAAQLRELGAELLDIHGQNDGRKLLDESAHLTYLDSFGDLSDFLDNYRESYEKQIKVKAEIERLSTDESEKERRIEMLRYQVEEIERAKIRPGEQSELTSRRDLLTNAAKLTDAVETAFEALYGGDMSVGAIAQIGKAHDCLSGALRYSDVFLQDACERLNDLRYAAQDISDNLRDFRAELEFSPGELDELEARLDVLKRIERKYGSEDEALEHLKRAEAELFEAEDSENMLAKLEIEFDNCMRESKKRAETLSKKRKDVSESLRKRIMDELSQLNMPSVVFIVEFSASRSEYGLSGNGCDEVRFLMSANPGETPGRISRIASGGELARIMLALKNVLGGKNDSGAMVFDEVDTGVSGIAAQRVGEKLAKLARGRQVLCVTHLPQIAVMADTHFEIRKNIKDGRTYTHVSELDVGGRKKEVARLSGGENITATALTSAAEQLAAAEEYKSKLRN